MSYGLDFAPHVPLTLLWTLVGVAAVITLIALLTRARGGWTRGLAFAVALIALANPLIVQETRAPLADVMALIVDHSASMDIRGRRDDADKAADAIKKALAGDKSLEVRTAEVTSKLGEDTGTQGFAALSSALADVPPDRIAGAIIVTDGEVHDAPTNGKPALPSPINGLIVGQKNERDRKLTIVSATRYAIVGQSAPVTMRIEDFGAPPGGSAQIDVNIDGQVTATHTVPTGTDTTIDIPVEHEGENVVEISARPGPAELTLANNHAVITVNGVRDRLRVALISGEPNAGERVWRSLLKADPSVDLVHFTILRPPDKQDATPVDELSLIAFPSRELFVDKLSEFDLVIFDRYRERGILPLAYFENISRYVDNGGALLVTSGPEFTQPQSIYHTPLAAVLPAQPTGDIITQPFKPTVTADGMKHPVTQGLEGANTADKPASWGRWFRVIGSNKVSGETLMSGAGEPLLVLDHVQQGRVAELLSDQSWLWARGFEGGGPESELLRRLAHWLMKEPELQEERLTATVANGQIVIERHTMADSAKSVLLTYPSNKQIILNLTQVQPGLFRGAVKADELGLYRATDGTLNAVTAAGPLNPKEVSDMRATDAILKAPTQATGGDTHWLVDGMPTIRRVSPGSIASGDGWVGLRANGAYRVTSVEQRALLPVWGWLLLVLASLLLAWRLEGR